MKILTTVSAIVFLMILTTGLATAKKAPVPAFPFFATGDVVSVTDAGVEDAPVSTTIYIYEAGSGLFWGAFFPGSLGFSFSAVQDSSGVYTLNGVQTVGGALSVTGKFTITYVKKKGFETAIQFATLGNGISYTGTLLP